MMDERDLLHALRAPWPSERHHRLGLDASRPGFRRRADPDGRDVDRITAIPRSARPSFGRRIRGDAATRPTGAPRLTLSATRLVATVAIIALAAGGLFLAGGQGPSPVSTVGPASPSPTAAPSARLGQGPALSWTKLVLDPRSLTLPDPIDPPAPVQRRWPARIAWLGDRFVLVDEDAGAVSTSTDGASWVVEDPEGPGQDYFEPLLDQETAIWQDRVVGWHQPEAGPPGLHIVRPPDEPITKSSFDGKLNPSAGVGPAGIVATATSYLDHDALVTSVIGPDWVEHMTSYSRRDGVIHIRIADGRSADIVLAEYGIEGRDFSPFGWFSPDGAEWTPIPGFPPGVEEVVGVSDGFVARASASRCDGCPDGYETGDSCDRCHDRAMWHSPDGLTWREIGPTTWEDVPVGPWAGGVLYADSDGSRLALWDSAGMRELPIGTEAPARSSDASGVSVGPLGILWFDQGEVLFSPDGIAWSLAALPDDMARGAVGRETVAIGERSVLVLTWTEPVYESEDLMVQEPIPSLWLGTLAP